MKRERKVNVVISGYPFELLKCFFERILQLPTRLFPAHQAKSFVRMWTDVLAADAKVFNGLYTGLVRVEAGKAKNPQKTLKEWYDRTRFKWENGKITKLSTKVLLPVIEREDPEECAAMAKLLLEAVEAAGLHREAGETLVLNEQNANAYTEWNGEELYVGDTVELMFPAWFQKGTLIEQGICTLLSSGEA